MIRRNKAIAMGAALVGTAALAIHLAPGLRTTASDHVDSPTINQDTASDLGDTWAFLDPNDNSKVVMVMSTQPFIISSEAIGQAIFDNNVRYRFEIENTGDAQPDRFIDVTYSQGLGRLEPQTANIRLPNGQSFTAPVTVATQEDTPPRPVVTDRNEVSFFAGSVDDPFFLDNTAANRFVLSSIMRPGRPDRSVFQRGRDTYAGFNTLVTSVSVPASMLRGSSNVIGINSVTQRQRVQIVGSNGRVRGTGPWLNLDRNGGPLVNNGLIPAGRKDEYNGASTVDDARGRFQADIVKSLRGFGTDQTHINMILDAAVQKGDILRLDLTVPNRGPNGGNNPNGGFGNTGGRRLGDDVADAVFTMINNGRPLSDNVDANEVRFRDRFPFVANSIQPNPRGVNSPDDRTRL